MSSEQIVWIADLMHVAEIANDLDETAHEAHSMDPSPQAARSA
jgi:hypothetical protein